jgi:CIC family chloride channel protein
MAAVVAGTTHASLTALIMVFEMTNNYKIILPLMLTIIIATTISKRILKGSLYTLKFDKEGKGIDIYGRKTSVLRNISISSLIEKFDDVVTDDFTFQKLLAKVKESRFNNLLVKNDNNNIIGKIAFQDIRDAILDDETRSIMPFLVAGDLMVRNVQIITNDKNSEDALQILEKIDMDFLPVRDKDTGKFLGIVSTENILKKYQNELFIQQSEQDLALN